MLCGPGVRGGGSAPPQHLRTASAPTPAARSSEKLGAKPFSKCDPYWGAFQEAEVFGKLGERSEGGAVTPLGAAAPQATKVTQKRLLGVSAEPDLPELSPLNEPIG